MKKMLIWDKYDETYREVIDVKELAKYIQDLIIKIKDKKIEDMFITASQGKLDTIIVLDTILNDLEVEDD
jgi:hypothetical protein